MRNIKDFYILGLPIDTELGRCDFLTVKDYPDYFDDLQYMSMTKDAIIYEFGKVSNTPEQKSFLEELKSEKVELYDIATQLPEFINAYLKIFMKVFNDEKVVNQIFSDKELFYQYRKLVLMMSCTEEEEVNPNPEIQKWLEKSKKFRREQNGSLTFAGIVSSVAVYCGKSYKEIWEMTIYQLYDNFHRISLFKGYDTSTLFATVSSEKVNIENWYKEIDLYKKDENAVSKENFSKKANSIFNNG